MPVISTMRVRVGRRSVSRRKASWTEKRLTQALVAIGMFVGAGFATASLGVSLGWDPSAVYSSSHQGNAEVVSRTGLILFTSPNVDTCRQQRFDNTSGQQRDDGIVDCRRVLYQVQKDDQRAARVSAIGDAFRSR